MKTIIITGGSDGLGYAVAKLLTKDNNLYLLSRNERRLEEISKEIKAKYRVCDVSNWEEVDKTIKSITKEVKKIDILINNAGIWVQGPIDEASPEKIEAVFRTNTLGTIFMTKAITAIMKTQKSGTILNVISRAGLSAADERSIYYSSKWAITGFTKSLQVELGKYGVKVMGFYPGGMNTEFFNKAGNPKDMNKMLDVKEAAKTIEFMVNQDELTNFLEVETASING